MGWARQIAGCMLECFGVGGFGECSPLSVPVQESGCDAGCSRPTFELMGSGSGLAGGAEVALRCLAPAQFGNAGFGCRLLSSLAEAGVDGELEVQLGPAAVAVHFPGVNGQLAEGGAGGGEIGRASCRERGWVAVREEY